MLKQSIAALALGAALFTAGQAMAADYVIDKEGQHAFVNFKISHLEQLQVQQVYLAGRAIRGSK